MGLLLLRLICHFSYLNYKDIMAPIYVDPDFGYALLAAIVLCFVYILHGPCVIARARSKAFSKQFLEENFGEIHRQSFGKDIGGGGAPDSGNGWYSEKLDYKTWVEFNLAQRTQIHILEWMPLTLLLIVIGGIKLPIPAAIAGFIFTLGRIILSIGVVCFGPRGRSVGGFIFEVAMLGNFVIAIWSLVKIYT